MGTREEKNWELIGDVLAAEGSGKSPRVFSSRRTLFGIPSALDQELEALSNEAAERARDQIAQEQGPRKAAGIDAAPREPQPEDGWSAPTPAHRVVHPLDPVFDEQSSVLILGTMPSPKSRETGFYYNHPQNRFWKVMAALFDEPLPASNSEKRALALRHGIALWDVLAECTIKGASDGSIADCVPNDIGRLLGKAPIQAVFCTGAKAAELYAKRCEAAAGMPATRLPSTSPANAATSLDQLIEAYQAILPFCR
ncbi:DNA-deoxyinosine glycosylase [Parvibacter caecicola]|uniref:DNA-deoxyinosine glycosylase n=1 Tax=Parvibacter caecicola TaxID=747645 RepID=UPI0030B9059D